MRITVNGRPLEVEGSKDLLTTCLSAGIEIPHFCWHGDLGSVGACRLCAVRVHDGPEDTEGRIEMACMTPVREGQRIEVMDPEAERFRARIVEWLMVNHPHDCAVCEEGGACHLQDMVVASGHHRRRAEVAKRTHRNQDHGPFLTQEMSRCIGCYRCLRFYRDYAGGRDFEVLGAHDRVWFGRTEPGALDSPFAGNLAEVCPTGVFDDRWWSRHYARPWDMAETPSICANCAVGCNITLFERGGTLRKVQNRTHGTINGSFLCDRGRFGALAAEAARPTHPTRKGAGILWTEAIEAARALVARGAVGIGSPRACLETNFALRRLVGEDRFFAGCSASEAALVARMTAILRQGPAGIAAIRDIERADAVLVLGEDLTGTAPRAALALRQAARGAERRLAAEKGVPEWMDAAVRIAGEGRRSPVAVVTPLPDALDEVALWPLRRAPAEVGAFGQAVAAAFRGEEAAPEARAVAEALAAAEAPVVIAGAGLGLAGPAEAAAAIAAALGARARIALFPPEAGSLGLALLGGTGLERAVAELEAEPRPVILLDASLPDRAPAELVERLMAAATEVMLLDWLDGPLAPQADLLLPVTAPAETSGTYINHEGRAQRFFTGRPSELVPAWRLLAPLCGATETTLDEILAALAHDCPDLAAVCDAAPGAGATPVARLPARASGRTAFDLAGRLPEGQPRADAESALVWSMEGAQGLEAPPALRTRADRPGLHSASSAWLGTEGVGGPVRGGDPGVHLFAEGGSGAIHAGRGTPLEDLPGEGFRLLPLHDPFSASSADRASPPLAERASAPRLLLHPEDAAALGAAEGARLLIDGIAAPAPLSLDPSVPRGHLALSGARSHARFVTLEVAR
ncbi:NADH-quinone oxidoreductase subunit NuoG [Cereibacter sphaeroides]|uniref:NADH-quinone oxidoreductase subunit NuoG n=1 Tax=Cereibacter sphaeroides TaxID=1063 RepID=UPI000F51B26C|nr:NADH-quinone oxidoreductase subunit NuoG [Cereibacter sphaeroides]AZB68569.1 NADH-quinone oxidoreductase subunit NuoG [Cereibacter sphaeroides]